MAKYLIRKTAALLVAFSLPVAIAALPSIDRHDEHLNAAVAVQYQNKAEASQQYVDAASMRCGSDGQRVITGRFTSHEKRQNRKSHSTL